ncbi:SMP-30/gluconolactonase/LRE family protein [Microbispora sp. NEAU-D428]|uniref:SMP-30/gluconolactonase/LRE family protein n=1 Tax=Microbispora sitophila TaxID=2771537 RepID=UPI0018696DF2|nr:SMP-30/gluconolactonase/LRE family protein [Microbispora sitophila]MBE3014784.1 SMP-30/gluconolactonase/LRE family protein [Microbispora sitophila]
MTNPPVPATTETFQLAEGPVWDAARDRLLWVDILAGAVLEGRLDGDRIEVTGRHEFDSMVGAVAVAADGAFLVAAQEHLVVLHPDGTRRDGPRIVPAGQSRRLNDAGVDPAGRFLVGTLSLDGPSQRETLVRVEADGRLTELDGDLRLSNGLAWSADGRALYSVDTGRHTVFVRDYDPATGAAGERRVHLRVDDGLPDGIALDAEGHLWVAVWEIGEVRRYAPDTTLTERIPVPAPHTSSVAFAGEDLRTLVITTASAELTDDRRRTHPDSGRLFATRVEVPGAPVPVWSGQPQSFGA